MSWRNQVRRVHRLAAYLWHGLDLGRAYSGPTRWNEWQREYRRRKKTVRAVIDALTPDLDDDATLEDGLR